MVYLQRSKLRNASRPFVKKRFKCAEPMYAKSCLGYHSSESHFRFLHLVSLVSRGLQVFTVWNWYSKKCYEMSVLPDEGILFINRIFKARTSLASPILRLLANSILTLLACRTSENHQCRYHIPYTPHMLLLMHTSSIRIHHVT